MNMHTTTDTQLAPTDAELLGLNVGEVYFSESPSKYPEVNGTQYHAGAPGVLAFAREALAKWGAQPVVPAGYALVPVEPTPEMLSEIWVHKNGSLSEAYRAMLAAAPQPVAREPLTLDEFRKAFHEYTGCIVGTNQGLLMAAKSATERAHGIT